MGSYQLRFETCWFNHWVGETNAANFCKNELSVLPLVDLPSFNLFEWVHIANWTPGYFAIEIESASWSIFATKKNYWRLPKFITVITITFIWFVDICTSFNGAGNTNSDDEVDKKPGKSPDSKILTKNNNGRQSHDMGWCNRFKSIS